MNSIEVLYKKIYGLENQVKKIFELNGWDYAEGSRDMKLIMHLQSTMHKQEFNVFFNAIQKNPDFRELLLKEMEKGTLDSVHFDKIKVSLEYAYSLDGVLEEEIAAHLLKIQS